MLPSFLSNLFWAQNQDGGKEGADNGGWSGEPAVEHTATEEAGDWLLITTPIGKEETTSYITKCLPTTTYTHTHTHTGLSPTHSSSSHPLRQDSDGESICSDSSWVITPAPAFQGSSLVPPIDSSHPLEDLLIEHPTMSVYHGHGAREDDDNLNKQTDAGLDTTNDHIQSNEPLSSPRDNLNEQQQNENNRELVLRQNRQRQQLAVHMQLPLGEERRPGAPPALYGLKPQQLTRKVLKRQNANSVRHRGGKLHQGNRIQKCSFKAGRRRCWIRVWTDWYDTPCCTYGQLKKIETDRERINSIIYY